MEGKAGQPAQARTRLLLCRAACPCQALREQCSSLIPLIKMQSGRRTLEC